MAQDLRRLYELGGTPAIFKTGSETLTRRRGVTGGIPAVGLTSSKTLTPRHGVTGGVPAGGLRRLEPVGRHQRPLAAAFQVPAPGRHDVSGWATSPLRGPHDLSHIASKSGWGGGGEGEGEGLGER